MRYLLFVSILMILACRSPYRNLPVVQGKPGCVLRFKPVFGSELYNTQVNVAGKHLSGLLIIKTMPEKYEAVEKYILDHHSYDTPEIVAIDSEAVSAGYLKWLTETL